MRIFWFNWPSHIGGADTKFTHLLGLLKDHYDITVVPNSAEYFKTNWLDWLRQRGHKVALREELPEQLDGWAISLCNGTFLEKGAAEDMKRRGLKVAWSSEMMWHFKSEAASIRAGHIDVVLYVSPAQRAELEPGYLGMLGKPTQKKGYQLPDPAATSGNYLGKLPWVMTGNFIDPAEFPFIERGDWKSQGRPFTIGRLSRPDPDKFPDDFPKSYERLGLVPPVKYRVMAWSEKLTERWSEHIFDDRWELLPGAAIPTAEFLQSLDVLVYNTSPRFRESWGRAVVEAMLTGCVPIVPRGNGHHLEKLIKHEYSGFLCSSPQDYGHYVRLLQQNPDLLREMSRQTRHWAQTQLCNPAEHLALWQKVFV